MMKHFAVTALLAAMLVQSALSAPRARSHARQGLWCSYLRGQMIPLSQADNCDHGHIATPCGALCKKGPGQWNYQIHDNQNYILQVTSAEAPGAGGCHSMASAPRGFSAATVTGKYENESR